MRPQSALLAKQEQQLLVYDTRYIRPQQRRAESASAVHNRLSLAEHSGLVGGFLA